MRAFLSWKASRADAIIVTYREQLAAKRPEATINEARFILAETEQRVTMFGGHCVSFPVSLTLLNRDFIDDSADEATALAQSLAAILPVLDALEAEA